MSSAITQLGNTFNVGQGNINITAISIQTSTIAADNSNYSSLEKKVADWLFDIAVVNHYAIQAETYAKVAPGTALWIIDTREFKDWISGQLKTLWGVGIPGVGKTLLTSSVIRHLEMHSDEQKTGKITIFAYCRFNDDLTVAKILASLLGQLVKGSRAALLYAHEKLYTTCMDKKTLPGGNDLCTHLQAVITLVPARVYIAIDALDELRDSTREALLNILLTMDCSIFLTSREISLAALGDPNICIQASNKDLSQFITHEVRKLPKLLSLLEKQRGLLEEIIQQVMVKSDGMFLLAALQLSALGGVTTIRSLRKALKTLPTTLDDMYKSNVERILNQQEEEHVLACNAILWVTHAARPLQVHELLEAVALDFDSTELYADAITHEQTLISVCCGLLTVEKKTGTVRLIHYTTYGFFSSQASKLWSPFACPHTYAAMICAVYLQVSEIYKHNISNYNQLEDFRKSHPFAGYACIYLGHHTACSDHESNGPNSTLVLNQLSKNSYVLLTPLDMEYRPKPIHHGTVIDFGALHGILSFTEAEHQGLNKKSKNGYSPLFYATMNGHISIVKHLIAASAVDVNESYAWGSSMKRTSLLVLASSKGYREVAQLLTGHPAININAQREDGQTALHHVSRYGHASFVELLLGHPAINVNTQEENGWTALHCASIEGHASVVELLVEHPAINVNAQEKDGWTALHYASRYGHASVVELLLEHPAINVNAQREHKWTALHYASKYGHASVVEVLLRHPKINVNAQDGNGYTALRRASIYGYKAIVIQLIQHPSIDVNAQTRDGYTALQEACANNHLDVVGLFLGHSSINVNIQDNDGDTALHQACIDCHTSAVQLLLGHPAISINIQNKRGYTALSIASRNGHSTIVQLLSRWNRDNIPSHVA